MSKLKIAGATLALVFAASGSAFAQSADEIAAEKAKTPSTEGIVTSAAVCLRGRQFLDACLSHKPLSEPATTLYSTQAVF